MITQIEHQKDLVTEQVIGCCFKVHNSLGPGFPEKVYQSALAESLCSGHLSVERERRFSVMFESIQVGDFHVDLLVGNRVIIEIKAVIGMMPKVFTAQLLAYLKASGMPVGLLVNFGNPSCEVKRLVLSAKSRQNR